MRLCIVENCENTHCSRGYCKKHYTQIKRHGCILKRTKYDANEFIDHKDTCNIILYNKDGKEKARTIIDRKDKNKCKRYKWYLGGDGYVITHVTIKKRLYLHLFLIGKYKGVETDHVNRNKLNNRRTNLRLSTPSQNKANTVKRKNNKSGYKGVSRHTINNKWVSYIRWHGKTKNLGSFTNKLKAALAYNEAAKKHFGEFAFLNKIKKENAHG